MSKKRKNNYEKKKNGNKLKTPDQSEKKLNYFFGCAVIVWIISEYISSKWILNSMTLEVFLPTVIITVVLMFFFWITFFCLNDYKNKWLQYALEDKWVLGLKVFFSLVVGFFLVDSLMCSFAIVYTSNDPIETVECPIDTFYSNKRGATFVFLYKGERQVISMKIPSEVAENTSSFVYEIETRKSFLNMDVIEHARFRRKLK